MIDFTRCKYTNLTGPIGVDSVVKLMRLGGWGRTMGFMLLDGGPVESVGVVVDPPTGCEAKENTRAALWIRWFGGGRPAYVSTRRLERLLEL